MGCGGSKSAEERAAERMDAEIAKTAAADAEAERQKIKLLLLGTNQLAELSPTFQSSQCDTLVQDPVNPARAPSSSK